MNPNQKCEKSPTGQHEPLVEGCALIPSTGSTRLIIDVPCKHCGTVGSVQVDVDSCEVCW
jgi:hypothetical protein